MAVIKLINFRWPSHNTFGTGRLIEFWCWTSLSGYCELNTLIRPMESRATVYVTSGSVLIFSNFFRSVSSGTWKLCILRLSGPSSDFELFVSAPSLKCLQWHSRRRGIASLCKNVQLERRETFDIPHNSCLVLFKCIYINFYSNFSLGNNTTGIVSKLSKELMLLT